MRRYLGIKTSPSANVTVKELDKYKVYKKKVKKMF